MKELQKIIAHWWSELTLQTRLLGLATLVGSILMSALIFWAVNTIGQDARLNDTRFGRDLGLLLASNVTAEIAKNNIKEVAQFSHRFYSNTSSIRYMLYADIEGKIYLGIPFSESEVQNSLLIQRRLQLPPEYADNTQLPMVRQHKTPDGEVTDVFIPLNYEGKYLGVLAIGINPNPTLIASSRLTRDITIAAFITIWVMVILGAVLNALTITRPIKELVVGVTNIADKNFKQRIDLPLPGELGKLITSFNQMAERLEHYEAQNIEELTAEKAKLETLVTTIADGAILIDPNLSIILANPNAQRLFNWEHQNIIGKNVLYHLPNSIQIKITRSLYQMINGELERDEYRINLEEQPNRVARILLTRVLDQSEKIKGIAMTIQDITREVELNEAKSQFISNVSHELRTPLFNIKSFIETLYDLGEQLSLEERQEFLQTANRETDRLTRLVNDVLDLSKLESHKTFKFEGIDISQMIEQTLRTYQLNAKEKKIELSHQLQPNLPLVTGNYDLLLQVLANLVGNSLKFTYPEGKIMIRAYYHHPGIRVEINDTGIGIDPQHQQTIFERFHRVENQVHTLEGTGLGLSIVHNIIEKHQTTIQVISELGIGTTFWFDLTPFTDQTTSDPNPHSPKHLS